MLVQGNISNEVYIDLKHVFTVYYILYDVHIFSSYTQIIIQ